MLPPLKFADDSKEHRQSEGIETLAGYFNATELIEKRCSQQFFVVLLIDLDNIDFLSDFLLLHDAS
jgi:hypothetical protein